MRILSCAVACGLREDGEQAPGAYSLWGEVTSEERKIPLTPAQEVIFGTVSQNRCDGTQRKYFPRQSSSGAACGPGPSLPAQPISPLPWCCSWRLPASPQIMSCFSSPTQALGRSTPHCWGQALEERFTSLLNLQTITLLVHYICQKYSGQAKVPHSTVCITAFKGAELAHSTPSFIPRIISLNCRHCSPTCGHVRDYPSKKIFSGGLT